MKNNHVADTRTPRKIDAHSLSELGAYIDSLQDGDDALIEVLHHAQAMFGYLPSDVQLFIARRLDLPGATVFGVVSFYSFFTMEPPGKHTVSVCMGTACFVRGADKVLHRLEQRLGIPAGETTADRLFTLKDVRCVGACGLAPVVTVDDKVFGRVSEEDIESILSPYEKEDANGH